MKRPALFLLTTLLLGNVESIIGQNQKKIDSVLQIIGTTETDTLKAENYLTLTDLTLFNDPTKASEYIEKASFYYTRAKNLRGLANVFAKKANYFYSQSSYDSARFYLRKSVNTSLEIKDSLRAAVIRHNLGILALNDGRQEEASDIMDINIPVFIKYGDSVHLANAYLMKGKIALLRGFFNIALEETYNALRIHELVDDTFRRAEDLLQIGVIYQDLKEHGKAITVFEQSHALYEEIAYDKFSAQVLNYLGVSNIHNNALEAAGENFKEALELSKKLDYKANIARTLVNLGDLEYHKGNFPEAIDFYRQGADLWKSVSSSYNEADVLLYIGKAHFANKEYTISINYFDRCIAIGDSINSKRTLKDAYLLRSLAKEKLTNYKEALHSLRLGKTLSDTIYSTERTRATEELITIYETEKKEQQIVLQKNEIDLLEQKAEISDLQRILMGAALILSLLGFYALRQKMKRNKLEREKVDAELAFKKKELTTHALHLAKKNEVLESVKQKAKELKLVEKQSGYQQLIQTINFDQQDDRNWENFTQYFEQVHKDFASNVKSKYPEVTKNELRFMALMKMNMSSKEIAAILNISTDGIKKARQRLRKKMALSPEDSLENAVLSI
ncbi:tetratricopeptide repeat protein [Flavobacteriaceae bacterium 3-367]|uniref:tetratricopeptide repeat protein n=1 Tax=Eudoraea algarum TaxID=3417568 RepID=UPI003281E4DE